MKILSLFAILLAILCTAQTVTVPVAQAVDIPIVYVKQPITGPRPHLNDVEKPVWTEPGSKLIYRAIDGTETVLVDPGSLGGILDPAVSLDGNWVFYSMTPDATVGLYDVKAPSDLYKVNVHTKQIVRLTHSEFTPIGNSATPPQIHNVGACPIPGGRVIFESSRNQLRSSRDTSTRFYWQPVLQLFVMDEDGSNVEQVGYLNLGASRHPTLMKDGRIMWASGEFHGLRSQKLWGLWASKPDGRTWEPLFSAFDFATTLSSLHWQSQSPNGHVQLLYYYPVQQSGYGNLLDFVPGGGFESPDRKMNPIIADRSISQMRFPLQPVGVKSLTPWATGMDGGGPKVSHPSAAPGGLLVSYGVTGTDATGLGGSMGLKSGGVYFMPGAGVTNDPTDLIKVVDEPNYFEVQPRAVIPIEDIYGEVPPEIPWLPNPTSTPFGFVGSSGVYSRESKPLNRGVVANEPADLWSQGGDVGEFENSDIDKIRILLQNPTPKESMTVGKTWQVKGIERMHVVGEIPLRKFAADGLEVKDSNGDPDTSFLAKLPADHSFTFQLLDNHGQVLTHAMTWHQVRPGETRTDCRGCHAHHEPGIVFEGTEASKPTFEFADLTKTKPESVEYTRDIRPIFAHHCEECHGDEVQEAGLNLMDPKVRDSQWVLPFRARQSDIMLRLLHTDQSQRMPRGRDPLSADEIRKIATWIDLGAAWDDGGTFHIDNQRPVLFVNSPRRRQPSVDKIEFGAFEWHGEIANVSVKASWPVNGQPANAEISNLFVATNNVHTLTLNSPVESGVVTVSVTDDAGRTAKIVRTFAVGDGPVDPPEPDPPATLLEELEAAKAAIERAILIEGNRE